MPERPHLCVFCGSRIGTKPIYAEAARRVGTALGRDGLGLVYGGGRVGLMGLVADAALDAGGRVVGVIPEALSAKEIAHPGLTELVIVSGMHERKALMAERSRGFLALPGGVGTFEEFFEVVTWAILGLHRKPMGLLNVEGYYDPLLRLIDHAVDEGFLRPEHRELVFCSADAEAIISRLATTVSIPTDRMWLSRNET